MNTKHVPDLEPCKELDRLCKEKGIVVPETEFYWFKSSKSERRYSVWSVEDIEEHEKEYPGSIKIPAPLVSEQGEWLKTVETESGVRKDYAFCNYYFADGEQESINDTSEANARQKMLNHLIAEGIITNL